MAELITVPYTIHRVHGKYISILLKRKIFKTIFPTPFQTYNLCLSPSAGNEANQDCLLSFS